MKVHLRQIPAEGLHLDGEDECPIQDLTSEDMQCSGPLRYSLDVGISEGALWANGSLSQAVQLRCVSCLETFDHTVEVPEFAVHLELGGPEVVNLTPAAREDLLLNLPAYPRCDREGGRVCPAAKTLQQHAADAPEVRKPDWSALDKLDL
jgi:uncharacterized metal-binding protein YceD (DUF177 family)